MKLRKRIIPRVTGLLESAFNATRLPVREGLIDYKPEDHVPPDVRNSFISATNSIKKTERRK
jgi:hypothetical protein